MKKGLVVVFVVFILILIIVWTLSSAQPPQVSAEIVALRDIGNAEGFARADRVRAWRFPDDHGPHPDFQTEWWYYTGNLDTLDGRHFGYQLTFFRRAVTFTITSRTSDWATSQIYFAHFALTDAKREDHSSVERFERGAEGIALAGASGNPYSVWLDDWRVDSLDAEGSRVRLRANDSGRALDLALNSEKSPVLHGENGLSQKTSQVGNASYYVSFTRLATEGTISSNGDTFNVKGLSWMDHEFSTTILGDNAVGWDWFSIQLGDKRDLMYFQIRQKDGGIEPMSGGTLIEADGRTIRITKEQLVLRVLRNWRSDKSGATYPASWQLEVPSQNIALTLTPYVADQEMRISFTYWEGAVKIAGVSNGSNVTGNGYVELTGYASPVR